MNTLRNLNWAATILIFTSLSAMTSASAMAQEQVAVTEITPNLLVFATASRNVVASVGPDG